MAGKKTDSLRMRWLINTMGIISALGIVCVFAVTAGFAAYHYSGMESDLRSRAEEMVEAVSDYENLDVDSYRRSCSEYIWTIEPESDLEVQFIDQDGSVGASTVDKREGERPETPEIGDAISTRSTRSFVGTDPDTEQRGMVVSCPLIHNSGEVIGVMRCVAPTAYADRQIIIAALVSLAVLLVVLMVVIVTNQYFLRSIMTPLAEITEKARRIANGSYGVQIQTRYRDEIGDLAETINEMSAKISQNERMQAEFISQLSHELRTPLTVINGWTETLLADENMDPDTRQGMKIISSEAQRLTEMVMELLDFTRMQDGRMTLAVEMTDIRGEFEDTVFMYGSRLAQDGISLHYNDDCEDIPEIPCDPKRMRQVFLNIMDNAAKHGGEGKRIEAGISYEDDWVVVRIRDFGPGIPEDEIPLVKKKFYKGSSSVRGTGIGLAVCDEIVELHGGTLTLENAQGGGTLVTVSLPAAQ